jgi:hypothetical protein
MMPKLSSSEHQQLLGWWLPLGDRVDASGR